MIDNNKDNPSKRTRSRKVEDDSQNEVQSISQQKTLSKKRNSRIKDLASEFLENGSEED
jgi:actin-related protein